MSIEQGVEAYLRFYETMSPESLADLDSLVTPDVHFVDPFNDVRGPDAMRRIFLHMFKTVRGSRFFVTYRAQDGNVLLVRWRFTGQVDVLGKEPWVVERVSEIHVDSDGRVARHLDHWDAASQFYERLPLIGPIFRLIRRRAGSR